MTIRDETNEHMSIQLLSEAPRDVADVHAHCLLEISSSFTHLTIKQTATKVILYYYEKYVLGLTTCTGW